MSDTKYSIFQQYGTNAERTTFTPDPASGIQPIYVWYETDTGDTYLYDTSWHLISSAQAPIPKARVATTANVTIATALNSGDSLDGVTLASGDRVLVKNQTASEENGIYIAGVTPARASDYNTYDGIAGSLIAVEEGTLAADTLWLCTSNPGGTLDTTALVFADYSAATVKIEEQSPSGTGTVSFTSIPGTYRDLLLVIRGAGSVAATSVAVNVTFNSDTGANYDQTFTQTNNANTANASVANANNSIGVLPGSTAPSNTAGDVEMRIFDYAGTTFEKVIRALASVKTVNTTAGVFTRSGSGWWRSTAAITRIDAILASGNYVSGTKVTLYGLR